MKLAITALILGLAVALPAAAQTDLPKEKNPVYPKAEYPIPGRKEGTTAFFHEKDAPQLSNKSYPAWYRGNAPDGKADQDSKYWYTQLIGKASYASKLVTADNLQFGTLQLKPGETYPAHNHPSPEIYFVLDGEADWWVDDEKEHVVPGSMIYHRPYAVHGWINTSKEKPLRVIWIWWAEGDIKAADLDKGARFTNPDLFANPATVKPVAVPVPEVRK